jgi:CheY-specific phosphatase CheX
LTLHTESLHADITEIAQTIWETVFLLPLEAGTGGVLGDDPAMSGAVQIDGAWQGAVMLQCPKLLADRLTTVLFQGDGTPSAEDVRDAIGELTNMLAGNVKALLPEPSRISLPTVAFGADYELSVVGTRAVVTVPFTCEGSPLTVTLLERTSEGP